MNYTTLITPNAIPPRKLLRMAMLAQTLILLVWWTMSGSFTFPSPIKILKSFDELARESNLLGELFVSVSLCLKAIGISALIALTISYAGQLPILSGVRWLSTKTRYMSLIGVSFVLMMSFEGYSYKLAMLTFGITGFMTISLTNMLGEIKKYERNHARTLGFSPWKELLEVDFLGRRHAILECIKQNVAISFVMLTTVEGLVRSGGGIGVLMLVQNKKFEMPAVFMMQMLILLVAIGIDWGIGKAKQLTCGYATLDTSTK